MINHVITAMIRYFSKDVRRINHALKVYGFAGAIGRNEGLNQHALEIVEMAAALHDIGIPESERKYGSCTGKQQELEGPPIARAILDKLGAKPETMDRICYLIGNHHTYTKIDGTDFQILIEADFLVNIHEEEMNDAMIERIKIKYFKTKSGIAILNSIYP